MSRRPRLRRAGKAIDVWPSRAYHRENTCEGKREDSRKSFVVCDAREAQEWVIFVFHSITPKRLLAKTVAPVLACIPEVSLAGAIELYSKPGTQVVMERSIHGMPGHLQKSMRYTNNPTGYKRSGTPRT